MALFLRILLLIMLSAVVPAKSLAQDTQTPPMTAAAVIDMRQSELQAISLTLQQNNSPEVLRDLREKVLQIQTASVEAVTNLTPEIEALDKRLQQLGEAGEGEDADISKQRKQLNAQRAELDSSLKRGRLLTTDATTTLETINRSLAAEFNRSTFQKVNSPFSANFWVDLNKSAPTDMRRLARLSTQAFAALPDIRLINVVLAILSGLGAVLLIGPVRKKLEALGFEFAKRRAPTTRIRRSGLAAWLTIISTMAAFFAFSLIGQALRWLGFAANDDLDKLLTMLVGTAGFAAFVVSLGRALLLVGRESWRLSPFDDISAKALRFYPLAAAVILAFGVALLEINRIAGVSPATNTASSLIIALCYIALIASILRTRYLLRNRVPDEAKQHNKTTTPSPWLMAATLACHMALIASVIALVFGYLNLSLFIGRTMVWATIIVAATYLILLLVDDLAQTICSTEGKLARAFQNSFGIRPSSIRQAGVIISALLRLTIIFVAMVLVFVPFGPGTSDVFTDVGNISSFTIAGITLEPGGILRAVAVLGLGLAAVRYVLGWLQDTYLPATELDSGARNSTVMIVKYAGIILAGLWAANTLGIGVERIALVVSALSVGIGFGLQAITQNFISGLILLTERPLKIGDTVRIGTDEGDVKKISVRATEIQIADRSTLIVPNSELITKTIRNMTPTDPVGRLEIAFSVPIETDAQKVRVLILDIYTEHAGVLDDPAPVILIDSIADGKINFKSHAFVISPRIVASTKSVLLYALLERFREAEIPLQSS